MFRHSLAACGLLCAAVSAQSFSYPDFSSTAQLNLLGNSVQVGSAVRLTASATNQTGWLWHQGAMPIVNGFDTTFTFRITPRHPWLPDPVRRRSYARRARQV